MPISDHYRGGQAGDRLLVSILTVDPPTGRIEVISRDSVVYQIGVGPVPVLFRWPREQERWTIHRVGTTWQLGNLIEDPESTTTIAGIEPGEAILQSEVLWTPSGERFLTESDVASALTPEAWRIVGGGGEPAFQNSWSSDSPAVAKFRKRPDGMVELRGFIVKATSTGRTVAFTLPPGYRPPAGHDILRWPVSGSTGDYVEVFENGDVKFTDQLFVAIDPIMFSVN